MNDVFEYHIQIEDFSSLLVWLMLLCLLGVCITGWPMLVMSKFFLTKTGSRFSIINFELPFSFSKLKSIIENSTERTKETVRMNLKLDYYFMLFAYLLLFFAGWYVLHQQQLSFQESKAYKILWVPFIIWLFDILENKTAFASLENLTKTSARLLLVFSIMKWLLVVGYVVVTVGICMDEISFD